MEIFENENIVIVEDENLNCLIQNWRGTATSEKFRECIEETNELFKTGKYNKILSNTQNFGIVKKEDTNWVNNYSIPLLIKNGLKYFVFVDPKNAFTHMSVEYFKEDAKKMLEIQHFESVEEAMEWLANLE